MMFDYARISTDGRTLVQQGQLRATGDEHMYSDTSTGTTANLPLTMRRMAKLRERDTVIIPAVDCLARDLSDLQVIARDIRRVGAGLD